MKKFLLSLSIVIGLCLFACGKDTTTTIDDTIDFPKSVCDFNFDEIDLSKQEVNEEIKQKVLEKLETLTLAEKAGQMVQAERQNISPDEVRTYNVGSILSGGGSVPNNNSPLGWLKMYNEYQQAALESSSGIPIIYGVDAVHGHNNVYGATIFPHNIGLGAANDSELMYKIGEVTAKEIKMTGLDWNFAPSVAVAQDIRWGRFYESYGECPALHANLVKPYVLGLQDNNVSANAKHFIADGGTSWDHMNFQDSSWALNNPDSHKIDQGDAKISLAELRRVHLQGYIEALNAGVDTVMISYSSLNGKKMHSHELIQELLKGELGFSGIVVSDYNAIQQLSGDYKTQVVTAINSGIDMLMEPQRWKETIQAIIDGVNEGLISIDRVNDAVSRILTIKYKRGLFDNPIKTYNADDFYSPQHREIAREAVRKSLVLLKNKNNILPLKKNMNILILGEGADNVGIQSGGWTIDWQGTQDKNRVKGTTIKQAFQDVLRENGGNLYTNIKDKDKADVVVAVISEVPYAEYVGDNGSLTLNSATAHKENMNILKTARDTKLPLVVILLSGRPLILTNHINYWDAFVAAWLPGSEGGLGIADVLFGDYNFTGKLPVTWPKTQLQVNHSVVNENYNENDYLFPYGFGLSYKK